MSSHNICSPSTGKVVVAKGRPCGHPGLHTKNLLRQREGLERRLGGREDMTNYAAVLFYVGIYFFIFVVSFDLYIAT